MEEENDDEHIESLIHQGSVGSKCKDLLYSTGIENPSMNLEEVIKLSEENDSPVSKKQGHKNEGTNDALVMEVDKYSKKFK